MHARTDVVDGAAAGRILVVDDEASIVDAVATGSERAEPPTEVGRLGALPVL
jgi:hypothetical protein